MIDLNRLSQLREKRGLNMRQVAQELGLPYTTYVNYEKGTREPNSETLIYLAQFFNTSIDYILGVEKPPASAKADTGDKRLDGIIDVYNELNEAGKDDLARHAEHLTYIPEYKKCDSVQESQIG